MLRLDDRDKGGVEGDQQRGAGWPVRGLACPAVGHELREGGRRIGRDFRLNGGTCVRETARTDNRVVGQMSPVCSFSLCACVYERLTCP